MIVLTTLITTLVTTFAVRTITSDAWPAVQPGLLRLYAMKYCPYSQRVRLVLEHKSVPYDIVFVYLKDNSPEWIRQRNPNGAVPILENYEGRVLYESLVCAQFADDASPQNKLTPLEPWEKARQAMLIAGFDKVTSSYSATVESLNDSNRTIDEKWSVVLSHLDRYEEAFGNGKFFGGRQPSLLDFAIWPWFERFPALAAITPLCVFNKDRFPKLSDWQSLMVKLPAVKNCTIDLQSHTVVIRSFAAQAPNYGYGLE